MSTESFVGELNPQQREALSHTEGPLLILAGAGSGKTRVITHKFAYLVREKGFSPSSILTVTFTNKAADEMKERISSLLPDGLNRCWIGTFHSQCNRILRNEISVLGYRPSFVIYDEGDRYSLLKHILKELKIYEALYRGVASRISALKSTLVGPDEFLSSGDGFGFDEKLAKVYVRYQDELKRCNALDFDDLIMLTVRIFSEYPDILQKYHDKFTYILVDEFQDTNHAQYRLVKLLASLNRNISVVGDDDQSIYRFRGAEIENILNFEKDFDEARLIKLEQNYRNTQNILDVSGSVIARNLARKDKTLWTERGNGDSIGYFWLSSEEEEAKYVAEIIQKTYLKGSYDYGDIAVLYRTNMQSRAIEEALRKERIKYRVIGGVSFYERKEVKDVIAYLRLAVNRHDNVSLRRVINTPSRGIGVATLNKIEQESKKKDISLYEAINGLCSSKACSQGVLVRLASFIKLLDKISDLSRSSASEAIKAVIEHTGYADGLDEERVQNIAELIASAGERDLSEFLDGISLITKLDESASDNSVSLMTLHMAKGLEFPVVFIVGLEEGLIPYFKSFDSEDELCEERRLLYVGMTRAKDLLYLTGAGRRRVFAKLQEQEASRFLKDVPRECCQWIEKKSSAGDSKKIVGKKENAVASRVPYKSGCRVRHPKWGVGVVRDCYGDGDDGKVCVNFPSIGVKKLLLKFANLERV